MSTRKLNSYVAIYEEAISNGCSPAFADMLASRQAPSSRTDREFLMGIGHDNGNQTPHLRKLAKKIWGFTPNPGDVYHPQLAPHKQPLHPQAWISGRGDVKKVCESRGWGCTGDVKATYVERPEPEPVKLSEQAIKRLVRQKLKENPDLKTKPLSELREQVIDKHGARSK